LTILVAVVRCRLPRASRAVTDTTPITGLARDQLMLAGTEPFPAAQVPQAPRNLDFEEDAAVACGPFVRADN